MSDLHTSVAKRDIVQQPSARGTGAEGEGAEVITADAILSILNEGPTSLADMRRKLSHASYVGLRYQLARMQECGSIERMGELYRLKQEADPRRQRG
jgi:hypothetical protein